MAAYGFTPAIEASEILKYLYYLWHMVLHNILLTYVGEENIEICMYA